MALSRRRAALTRRLHRRGTREREGLFLVEGVRSASDAVRAGAPIRYALWSPRLRELAGGPGLLDRLDAAGVESERLEDAELADLAGTETPQGVLLVVEQAARGLADLDARAAAPVLVLDAVQDPGNAGTLVRSAAAFGMGAVVALDGTVDPWNAKVVRASAGGLFSVPVVAAARGEVLEWLGSGDRRLLVADADGRDVAGADVPARWALAVGNEGAGPGDAVRAAAHDTLAVPMRRGTDSLNAGVAGAILMYALTWESQ